MAASGGIRLLCDLRFEDNTLDQPHKIEPAPFLFEGNGKQLETSVPPLSFSIFILERR